MYIQLNGQILQYEKEGEGDPMILLHGNGESLEIFDKLVPKFSDSHTIYRIDSRGQGGSATPKEYHYADMAEDVLRFIEALHIEKPLLCGFSDGAIIALLIAIEHSELLSSIVVCGANLSPKGLTGAARREIKADYRKDPNPLTAMMLCEPSIDPESLAKISVPTLICVGSNDMVKKKETKTIALQIPDSYLHIFEGESHSSYIVHSSKLAPTLQKFLDTIS